MYLSIRYLCIIYSKKRTKSELFGSSINYDKEFNINGQLKSVTDENGTVANYTYNANGNLIKETNPDGKVFYSEYDENGKLIRKTDYEGKVKFTKLNIEENKDIAKKYSISGIPCLLIFKEGAPVERMVGLMPKSTIISNIEKHI